MQHSTVRQHTLVATHSGDTGDRTHALHSAPCTVTATGRACTQLAGKDSTRPAMAVASRLPVLCYLCCCGSPSCRPAAATTAAVPMLVPAVQASSSTIAAHATLLLNPYTGKQPFNLSAKSCNCHASNKGTGNGTHTSGPVLCQSGKNRPPHRPGPQTPRAHHS